MQRALSLCMWNSIKGITTGRGGIWAEVCRWTAAAVPGALVKSKTFEYLTLKMRERDSFLFLSSLKYKIDKLQLLGWYRHLRMNSVTILKLCTFCTTLHFITFLICSATAVTLALNSECKCQSQLLHKKRFLFLMMFLIWERHTQKHKQNNKKNMNILEWKTGALYLSSIFVSTNSWGKKCLCLTYTNSILHICITLNITLFLARWKI